MESLSIIAPDAQSLPVPPSVSDAAVNSHVQSPSLRGASLRGNSVNSHVQSPSLRAALLRGNPVNRHERSEEKVARLLRSRNWCLATAESLTGGAIGAALTALPGASSWYAGGLITYQTDQKTRQLEVPADLIARHGVVSAEVVKAMAAGVRHRFCAQAAIAVSGLAGPDGGTLTQAVGTVWIAVSADHQSAEHHHHFTGDRSSIRIQTTQAALEHLITLLQAQ